MRRLSLALLAAAAAACSRPGPWMDRLDKNALNRRAKALSEAPTCRRAIRLESGRSYPVPAKGRSGPEYRLLFYPAKRQPSQYVMLPPDVEAAFPAGDGVGRCRALAAGASTELGDAVPPGLKGTKYYKAQVELYESLEKAGAAYFKGAGDPAQLKDFLAAFRTAAEPGLLPYYYRLSPDFWEWVRKQAGDSLPPA